MEYKRTEFLGVFLGGDDVIAKNWTLVEEKVNSVIKNWTFFSKGLSFIGRVLVVNSLCASKLWYIISVLQLSRKLYIVPSKGIH